LTGGWVLKQFKGLLPQSKRNSRLEKTKNFDKSFKRNHLSFFLLLLLTFSLKKIYVVVAALGHCILYRKKKERYL
jgi:hypothetical protein